MNESKEVLKTIMGQLAPCDMAYMILDCPYATWNCPQCCLVIRLGHDCPVHGSAEQYPLLETTEREVGYSLCPVCQVNPRNALGGWCMDCWQKRKKLLTDAGMYYIDDGVR